MITRRGFLQTGLGALLASGASRVLAGDGPGAKAKNCIVLWMNGGPSHVDTWDIKKPSTSFEAIATETPGLEISEHFPLLAKQSKRYSVIRSLTSKEADHGRATFYMHTGNLPQETVAFPAFGAVAAHEWPASRDLPLYVSVGEAFGDPGFLGMEYAPFGVDLDEPTAMLDLTDVHQKRFARRVEAARQAQPPVRTPFRRRRDRLRRESPEARAGDGEPPGRSRRSISRARTNRRAGRPATASSAAAACWRAGWSKAACALSKSRSTAGTHTKTISIRSRSSAGPSIRPCRVC